MSVKGIFCGAVVLLSASILCKTAVAEIVSFNSPGQWVTERTDNIVAKVQLDTSKIPQKKIEFSISKMQAGKKKLVATKSFKVTDYTQEYQLGTVGTSLIGGKDFLQIDWSIPGTKEKGTLFPFGIVNIDKTDKVAMLHAVKTKNAITAANFSASIAPVKYASVKGLDVGFMWEPKSLVVVWKKTASKDVIRLAFDSKNGKNAFLSYPDRIAEIHCANDSVATLYYDRATAADSLTYTMKNWQNEIKVFGDKNIGILVIPWFDLGLLPLDERVIGFAGIVVDEKGSQTSAIPEKAQMFVPGSGAVLF